jgi:hypothetical protein
MDSLCIDCTSVVYDDGILVPIHNQTVFILLMCFFFTFCLHSYIHFYKQQWESLPKNQKHDDGKVRLLYFFQKNLSSLLLFKTARTLFLYNDFLSFFNYLQVMR